MMRYLLFFIAIRMTIATGEILRITPIVGYVS